MNDTYTTSEGYIASDLVTSKKVQIVVMAVVITLILLYILSRCFLAGIIDAITGLNWHGRCVSGGGNVQQSIREGVDPAGLEGQSAYECPIVINGKEVIGCDGKVNKEALGDMEVDLQDLEGALKAGEVVIEEGATFSYLAGAEGEKVLVIDENGVITAKEMVTDELSGGGDESSTTGGNTSGSGESYTGGETVVYEYVGGGGYQYLSLNGSTLSLSPDGGSILLPGSYDGDSNTSLGYGGGDTKVNGDDIIIEALSGQGDKMVVVNNEGKLSVEDKPSGGGGDGDNQTLSISGNTLSISDGNSISLPPDTNSDNQTLSINGNILSIEDGNFVTLPTTTGGGADNWGTQTVVTTAMLSGDGTSGSPLSIAQQGASTGQILKWNGTAWVPATDVSGGTPNTDVTIDGTGTFADPLSIAQQGAVNGQVLKWNNTLGRWVPGTDDGGTTTWGTITGALSSQTDLQAALNGKEDLLPTGSSAQYIRGDKTLGTFTTDVRGSLSAAGPVVYSSITGQISCPTCLTTGSGLFTAAADTGSNVVTPGATLTIAGDGGNISTANNGAGTITVTMASSPTFTNTTISNNLTMSNLATGSTRCLQVSGTGVVGVATGACGTGTGGDGYIGLAGPHTAGGNLDMGSYNLVGDNFSLPGTTGDISFTPNTGSIQLNGDTVVSTGNSFAVTDLGANGVVTTTTGGQLTSLTGTVADQVLVWNGSTWVAGTPASVLPTFSGDVSGPYNNLQLGTGVVSANELANMVGLTAGTYGSATEVPVFTVDDDGRITSVTNTAITEVPLAGAPGNILVADGTSEWTSVALSGDGTIGPTGVLTLGVNYIDNITGTGLTVTGTPAPGWEPSLSVDYGSLANTAVEGDTQITIQSTSGKITGGSAITLGAGGTWDLDCPTCLVSSGYLFTASADDNTSGLSLIDQNDTLGIIGDVGGNITTTNSGTGTISIDTIDNPTFNNITLSALAGGGTQCLQIDNAGLVGASGTACAAGPDGYIGLAGPHIAGGSLDMSTYTLQGDGGATFSLPSTGDMYFTPSGGNFGIGTNTPQAGLHIAGSTLYSTNTTLTDYPTGGAIGTAATTVDVQTSFAIPQTTAAQILSLPSPTNTTPGRIAYIMNTGSADFDMHGVTIQPGSAMTYMWNGTAWVPAQETTVEAWELAGNTTTGTEYLGTNNADDLRIYTNGTQKAVLTTDGNLGLGATVTAPTSLLQTEATGAKTANYTGHLLTTTATSSTGGIDKIGLDIQSTGVWNGPNSTNIGLNVDVSGGTLNYAALFNGGEVGIGTTDPTAQLHSQATTKTGTGTLTTNASNPFQIDGSGTIFTTELHVGDIIVAAGQRRTVTAVISDTVIDVDTPFSAPLSADSFTYEKPMGRFVDSSGSAQVVVNADGQVGIGTQTPEEGNKLHVVGNTLLEGNTTVDGDLQANGTANFTSQDDVVVINKQTGETSSTPSWDSTPTDNSLPEGDREGHTMVENNGKLYVFGGYDGTSTYYNTVQTYNAQTDTWQQVATTGTAPTARDGHIATVYDGKMYVYGGGASGAASDSELHYLDLETMVWSGVLSPTGTPTNRRDATGVVRNGKWYVYGGRNGTATNGTDTMDIYDFATNTWSSGTANDQRPTTNPGQYNHSTFLQNNKMYVYGGNAYNGYSASPGTITTNTFYTYDITTDTWSTIAQGLVYDENGVYASSFYTTNVPKYAFDGDTTTKWQGDTGDGTPSIAYDFDPGGATGRKEIVTQYIVQIRDDNVYRFPIDWTFEGSNDNATWEILHSVTGESFTYKSEKHVYPAHNQTPYRYYRILVTDADSAAFGAEYAVISEITLMGSEGPLLQQQANVVEDQTVYLWGGSDGTTDSNTLYTYDLQSRAWGDLGSAGAPTARVEPVMAKRNGDIWVYGGSTGGTELWQLGQDSNESILTLQEDGEDSITFETGNKIRTEGNALSVIRTVNEEDMYTVSTGSGELRDGPDAPVSLSGNNSAAIYNNKYYKVIGNSTNSNLDIYVYDFVKNRWLSGSELPTSGGRFRTRFLVVVYDGKLYVWGGEPGSGRSNDIDIYDIATDTWSQGASGGIPVSEGDAVVYNGKMYAWSGEPCDSIWGCYGGANGMSIYNFATDSWSIIKNDPTNWAPGSEIPIARQWHSSVVYNDKMYIYGGHLSPSGPSLQIYDFRTNSWKTGASGPNRGGHQAVVYKDRMYIHGGRINYSSSNYDYWVHIYDIVTNTWTTNYRATTYSGWGFHDLVTYNDQMYFIGIDTSTGTYDKMQILDLGVGRPQDIFTLGTSSQDGPGSLNTGYVQDGIRNVFRFGVDGRAYTSEQGGWYAGGADLAEYYLADMPLSRGHVVSISDRESNKVTAAQATRAGRMMGMVSTNPGLAINNGLKDQGGHPIALTGQVPALVTSEGGDIGRGEYLTVSPTYNGYATRATHAGMMAGKALEPFSPDEDICKSVSTSNPEDLSWPSDPTGRNEEKRCYQMGNGVYVSKIMTFVEIGYANPADAYTLLTLGPDGEVLTPQTEDGAMPADIQAAAEEEKIATESGQIAGLSSTQSEEASSSSTLTTNQDIEVSGDVRADHLLAFNFDLAEDYEVTDPSITAGDVVAPQTGGNTITIDRTTQIYQPNVMGVISTEPGVRLSDWTLSPEQKERMRPVALAGRVPVKVTTENGDITKGDLLVPASKPGYAMKVCGSTSCQQGMIIGMALEDFSAEQEGDSAQVQQELEESEKLKTKSENNAGESEELKINNENNAGESEKLKTKSENNAGESEKLKTKNEEEQSQNTNIKSQSDEEESGNNNDQNITDEQIQQSQQATERVIDHLTQPMQETAIGEGRVMMYVKVYQYTPTTQDKLAALGQDATATEQQEENATNSADVDNVQATPSGLFSLQALTGLFGDTEDIAKLTEEEKAQNSIIEKIGMFSQGIFSSITAGIIETETLKVGGLDIGATIAQLTSQNRQELDEATQELQEQIGEQDASIAAQLDEITTQVATKTTATNADLKGMQISQTLLESDVEYLTQRIQELSSIVDELKRDQDIKETPGTEITELLAEIEEITAEEEALLSGEQSTTQSLIASDGADITEGDIAGIATGEGSLISSEGTGSALIAQDPSASQAAEVIEDEITRLEQTQLESIRRQRQPVQTLRTAEEGTAGGTLADLTVTGDTNLYNLGVTGTFTMGVMSMDGVTGEINSLAEPLKIQSLGLTNLELMGGKIVVDTGGNMIVREGDVTIERGDVIVKEGKIQGSDEFTGKQMIPEGSTETRVERNWGTPPQAIILTGSFNGSIWYEDVSENGFRIKIDTPQQTEAEVSWMAVW